jgi:hypothetical protein
VHAGGSGHNGGEKRNVLVVSVLLPTAVNFALRSEPQGGVKVLGMMMIDSKPFRSVLCKVQCFIKVAFRLCVLIAAVPITKLFAWGGGGTREDMCYERLRAEAFRV